MKRRILTALLAVCLVFALGTIGAFADEVSTQLPTAVNGVITLTNDVDLTNANTSLSNVTLDLNGHSIKLANTSAGQIKITGNVTIKDSSDTNKDGSGTGKIYTQTQYSGSSTGYEIISAVGPAGHLTLESGYVNAVLDDASNKGQFALGVTNGGNITINGGKVEAGWYAISGNGLNTGYSTIVINGGELISTADYALYLPHKGITTVNGGLISGAAGGIAQRAGELVINGGEINSEGTGNTGSWNDGSSGMGNAAVNVGDSGKGLYGDVDVTINGGDFSVANSALTINLGSTDPDITADIKVVGGTFPVDDASVGAFIPSGMKLDDKGEVVVDSDKAVASIGKAYYDDLQEALDAAKSGETVVLQDNISVDLTGADPKSGKFDIDTANVTIDGNNKTITVIGGNKTAHVLNIGANGVTVKDLTIVGSTQYSKHGINVYQATGVKLSNVTSKNNYGYGVVVNGSAVTAENLNTSGNGWGGVNVDPNGNTTASFNLSGANTSISETNGIKIDNDATGETATVSVSNGYVRSIVEAAGNLGTTTVNVTGGTFGASIVTVADTHPDYQVQSGSYYTYYNDIDAALAAAGAGDVVTYVGGTSATTTYTVTFNLYGTNYYTVTVPAGTEITLPRESYGSYYLAGWKCGGVTYAVGQKVPVNGPMTFTAIWKNGQYDIVIDATMKHGDIYTNVSSADAGEYVYITVDPDLGYKLKSLTVYVSLNNKVTVYKTSALSQYDYYFIMPGATVFVTATFEADGMPFVDVRPYQWHYDAVYYVWSNGLMQGLSDYIFEPDGDMTRAMFWAVLGRIDGEDITGIDWVSEARSWAMTNGVSDGTDPNGKITREQMVTMLWRFLDKPTGTAYMSIYSDANTISSWAKDAMVWAIDEGIIEGITSTTIVPRGTATRAQCATIFMRAEID